MHHADAVQREGIQSMSLPRLVACVHFGVEHYFLMVVYYYLDDTDLDGIDLLLQCPADLTHFQRRQRRLCEQPCLEDHH